MGRSEVVDVKDRNRQVNGQPSRRWIWLDFYSSVATAEDFRREAKKKKEKVFCSSLLPLNPLTPLVDKCSS